MKKKSARTIEELRLPNFDLNFKTDIEILMFNVIVNSWNDAFYSGTNITIEKAIAKNEALKFFSHEDADYCDPMDEYDTPYEWTASFDRICDVCGFDPDFLRERFLYFYKNKGIFKATLVKYRKAQLWNKKKEKQNAESESADTGDY